MRVLVSGYYGFGNFGDEALLEVIVRHIRMRFPNADLEVLSATPVLTAQRLGVVGTPRWPWRVVREAVGRADVVLSGGGGLLQNATSLRSLLYYAGILRQAIRTNRKAMVFAQSIGPLDRLGRFVIRRFCRGLNCATVRDQRSYAILRELLPETPVERTADPAFLYDLDAHEADLGAQGLGPESGPYAVVSVRKFSGLKESSAAIARVVDRLAAVHRVRSAFLPLGGAPDAEVSTDIIRACSSAPVLLPECSLAQAASVLRGARVVVGTRLHALVLAARFGVPFIAIAYDPKVSALCEEMEYSLPPLWAPGSGKPDDAFVDALVDRVMDEHTAMSAQLTERSILLRAAAERNFDALGTLLSSYE